MRYVSYINISICCSPFECQVPNMLIYLEKTPSYLGLQLLILYVNKI